MQIALKVEDFIVARTNFDEILVMGHRILAAHHTGNLVLILILFLLSHLKNTTCLLLQKRGGSVAHLAQIIGIT